MLPVLHEGGPNSLFTCVTLDSEPLFRVALNTSVSQALGPFRTLHHAHVATTLVLPCSSNAARATEFALLAVSQKAVADPVAEPLASYVLL